MLKQNLLVNTALIGMPHLIDHDDKYEDVTMEEDLREIILDPELWKEHRRTRTSSQASVLRDHSSGGRRGDILCCVCQLRQHRASPHDYRGLQRLSVDRNDLLNCIYFRIAEHILTRPRAGVRDGPDVSRDARHDDPVYMEHAIH